MLELFIVRHGESVRNHACLLAHRGDFAILERQLAEEPDESKWPLTDLGHKQAALAGEWLRSNAGTFQAGYSSPFVRTLQTAHGLGLDLEFKLDERLREREWGDYAGNKYPADRYLADIAMCSIYEWKSEFPNAESIQDLVPSTAEFMADLRAKHSAGAVVLVTHGGRATAIEHVVEQSQPQRRFTNCCILHYRLAEGGGEGRVVYPANPDIPSTDWLAFGKQPTGSQ